MGLKILRILKKPDNQPGSSFEIAFTDTFDEKAKLLMPRKIIQSKTESKKWLLDHNFPNQDEDGWEAVFEILQAKDPTNNFGMLVNKTGFWNRGYLLPNGSFIGPEEKYALFLESELTKYLPNCSVSGSLDDWKKTIAPAALNSSRIMLAFCGGSFSGYLLKITGVESGGFHFFGQSSIGKTTLIRCSLSTSGPDTNMQSWNFTEAAVEEIAVAHNDGPICFDELKAAHPNPETAANITTSTIYKLSSGKGKAKSSKYAAEQYNWSTVILSTGEDSLAVHAKKGSAKRKAGEEVRMIDIPADAGEGRGIFETLPEDFNNANEYVKYLAEQVQQCYGTAQIAFLEKFIADLNDKDAKVSVKDRIKSYMKVFNDKHNINPVDGTANEGTTNEGTTNRFGDRFSLAYAAGCLAVEYGVLPFTQKQILIRISRCYKAALGIKPKTREERLSIYNKKLDKYLKNNEFPELRSKEAWTEEEINEIDGFTLSISGIKVVALKPEVARSRIPKSLYKELLKHYQSKGYLLPDSKLNSTRQISLNGNKIGRYHCFVFPRKTGNIEVAKKCIAEFNDNIK